MSRPKQRQGPYSSELIGGLRIYDRFRKELQHERNLKINMGNRDFCVTIWLNQKSKQALK